MTTSSVITNRLSVTMTGLIIDYLFSSNWPALCSSHVESDPKNFFSRALGGNGKAKDSRSRVKGIDLSEHLHVVLCH